MDLQNHILMNMRLAGPSAQPPPRPAAEAPSDGLNRGKSTMSLLTASPAKSAEETEEIAGARGRGLGRGGRRGRGRGRGRAAESAGSQLKKRPSTKVPSGCDLISRQSFVCASRGSSVFRMSSAIRFKPQEDREVRGRGEGAEEHCKLPTSCPNEATSSGRA